MNSFVAQLAQHLSCKQEVVGLTPPRGSMSASRTCVTRVHVASDALIRLAGKGLRGLGTSLTYVLDGGGVPLPSSHLPA